MSDIPSASHSAESQASVPPPLSIVDRRRIHPMLFAFGVLAAIFFLYQVGGGVATFLIAGARAVDAGNVTLMRILTMAGQLLLVLLPTLFFARLLELEWIRVFPVRMPSFAEGTYALIGLFALQRLLEVYLVLQQQIPLPDIIRQLLDPIREMMETMLRTLVKAHSVPELVFVTIVVAVVPAVVEELMFRGVIQRSFERVMSPFVSAILTGTIFGLYHLNPFDAVPLIAAGVYFGILRQRSRTVILPMAAHFLFNLTTVLALYFGFEPDSTLPREAPALSALLLQFVFFGVVFTSAFLAYLRSTEEWRVRQWREGK